MFLLLSALLLQDEPVNLLIQKLGSDSIEEREEATEKLYDSPGRAEVELEKAAQSADPEVAYRARKILEGLHPFRVRVTREVLHLFSHASGAFETGRYDRTLVFCDELFRIDPRYEAARRLREETLKTIVSEEHRASVLPLLKKWREREEEDPARIPFVLNFRLPSRKLWRSLVDQIREDVERRAEPCDPEEFQIPIARKLEAMKIDLAFEKTRFDDILSFIRDFTGLNIVVDATIPDRVDPDRRLDLKVRDQTVGTVLSRLLSELGLAYTVTEEEVVLVTLPAKAGIRDERDPDRHQR
jgi:hypothetical protein